MKVCWTQNGTPTGLTSLGPNLGTAPAISATCDYADVRRGDE